MCLIVYVIQQCFYCMGMIKLWFFYINWDNKVINVKKIDIIYINVHLTKECKKVDILQILLVICYSLSSFNWYFFCLSGWCCSLLACQRVITNDRQGMNKFHLMLLYIYYRHHISRSWFPHQIRVIRETSPRNAFYNIEEDSTGAFVRPNWIWI